MTPSLSLVVPPEAPDDSLLATGHVYAAQLLLQQAGANPGKIVIEHSHDPTAQGLRHAGTTLVSAAELTRVFRAGSLQRELDGPRDHNGCPLPSADPNAMATPWITRAARDLARELKLPDPRDRGLRIIITHDVDRVTPTEPTSITRAIRDRLRGRRGWCSVRDCLKPGLFLSALERVLKIERDRGVRPWYFMLSGRYGIGHGDNRYGVGWPIARRAASMIEEYGGILGLHASYDARERDSYGWEARRLGELTRGTVNSHRHHYLRFDPQKLWSQLDAAGIDIDFSLCLSDRMGYRAPITGPFHPFDWTRRRRSRVTAIPTIAMDQPWWIDHPDLVLEQIASMLATAREVGGAIALLVHPERFAVDERWLDLFERVLDLSEQLSAKLDCSPGDLTLLSASR